MSDTDALLVTVRKALEVGHSCVAQRGYATGYRADYFLPSLAALDSFAAELEETAHRRDVWMESCANAERELERVKAERDTFKRGVNENADMVDEQRTRAEQAEAYLDMTLSALREISGDDESFALQESGHVHPSPEFHLRKIARAAIAEIEREA